MQVRWTRIAATEYQAWISTDKKIVKRINDLIKNIMETPLKGIGKPEPLKYHLQGKWSRRIDDEHRLVYSIENNIIVIYQCMYHY